VGNVKRTVRNVEITLLVVPVQEATYSMTPQVNAKSFGAISDFTF
jgi:hypothetical protein